MREANTPDVGQAAPDFALMDSSGATQRLGELVGDGQLVLVFYRGHW
jgi:peroxiredoxin